MDVLDQIIEKVPFVYLARVKRDVRDFLERTNKELGDVRGKPWKSEWTVRLDKQANFDCIALDNTFIDHTNGYNYLVRMTISSRYPEEFPEVRIVSPKPEDITASRGQKLLYVSSSTPPLSYQAGSCASQTWSSADISLTQVIESVQNILLTESVAMIKSQVHAAMKDNAIDVLESLLNRAGNDEGAEEDGDTHDFSLNKADSFGKTPLQAAVELGRIEIVYLLLKKGASVLVGHLIGQGNFLDQAWFANIFNEPEWEGHEDLIKHLICMEVKWEPMKQMRLHGVAEQAARKQLIHALKRLVHAGADPDLLVSAAYHGNLDILNFLLMMGAPIWTSNPATSALIMAAREGHPLFVEALLELGCDPRDALQEAIKCNRVHVVQQLLWAGGHTPHTFDQHYCNGFDIKSAEVLRTIASVGVDVTRERRDGKTTALHHAIFNNADADLIAAYVDVGASLSVTDHNGNTPVHYAANKKQFMQILSTAEDFIIATALKNNKGDTALHLAMATEDPRCRLDIVSMLLFSNPLLVYSTNKANLTALHLAFYCKDCAVVSLLLVAGADPHGPIPNKPRHEWPMLEMADPHGPIPNMPMIGLTMLEMAVRKNWRDLVCTLIDGGVSIAEKNWEGYTALHVALSNASVDISIIWSLIEAGAASVGEDEFPYVRTYLDSPRCQTDDGKLLQRLLDGGARLHVRDYLGRTPFLHALTISSLPPSKLDQLLAAGADASDQDAMGDTALMLAIMHRLPLESVTLLLKEGAARVNDRTRFGTTALRCAVWLDNVAVATSLLTAGADPSLSDPRGKIPLDYAKSEEMRDLLRTATHP